jgi:hypothetical protein
LVAQREIKLIKTQQQWCRGEHKREEEEAITEREKVLKKGHTFFCLLG